MIHILVAKDFYSLTTADTFTPFARYADTWVGAVLEQRRHYRLPIFYRVLKLVSLRHDESGTVQSHQRLST
jgi:hypothetical protein